MTSPLDEFLKANADKDSQGDADKPGAAYFRSSWQSLRLLVKVPSGHQIPEILFKDYCLVIRDTDADAAAKLSFLRDNVMKRDNVFTINELTQDEFEQALSIQENPPPPEIPDGEGAFEPFVNGHQAGSDMSPEDLLKHIEEVKRKQAELADSNKGAPAV